MKGHFRTDDGCRLAFEVQGSGRPVLWQHGLGATAAQPAEVFPQDPSLGVQRITLLCRGHEGSDLGDPARLGIAQFAADGLALLDHLGHDRAVLGGISLGAAIALRLACLAPERASALILARPAWVDQPAPASMGAYLEVARHLARQGAIGRALFQSGAVYREISRASPDNAASLVSFFTRPRPETTVALLSRLPLDGPGVTEDQIAALTLPSLVVVTGEDHVHRAAYGARLAALICGAGLVQITPKGRDRAAHLAEFRAALASFLADLKVPG